MRTLAYHVYASEPHFAAFLAYDQTYGLFSIPLSVVGRQGLGKGQARLRIAARLAKINAVGM